MAGISIEIHGLQKAKALLDKYEGKALTRRFKNATMRVSRSLASDIKSQTPVRTGELRRSVRAKSLRGGGAKVGPSASHRRYVIRGTRRQSANPFVDRAIGPRRSGIVNDIRREVLKPR